MSTPKEVLAQAENGPTSAVYNLNGFSVSPAELAAEIKRHLPSFRIKYAPDFRQGIADDWPQELDGSKARKSWDWQPKYDLALTTADMLKQLQLKKSKNTSKTPV